MEQNTNIGMSQVVNNVIATRTRCQTVIRRLGCALRAVSPGLFLRELLAKPDAVGAVWPSSNQLARCMAAPVPRTGNGLVVELGGGTGAVTQALLEQGVAVDRLVVVERSPAFVQHLRQRFPSVTVLQGDATRLAALLPAGAPIDAIVSSLPLRSLPQTDASAIVGQWHQLLRPGGMVVQFTYALRGQAGTPFDGFVEHDSRLVWANLPPARVMVLVREAHHETECLSVADIPLSSAHRSTALAKGTAL